MQKPDQVLDTYFLENRCMLIEIAATLDRYDRAVDRHGAPAAGDEARLDKMFESLRILAEARGRPDRAERLLTLFSDPID
jgi:hypothetical protein